MLIVWFTENICLCLPVELRGSKTLKPRHSPTF
uniref:Uncharacterized protein n=1 Tax=Rhizophora mucronata TaxID=61149 RepID=A0A2P2PQD3_RHIMU